MPAPPGTNTNNYQVFPSYLGTDLVTSTEPFLLPPTNSTLGVASYNKTITLPFKFTQAGAVSYTYSNDDFQFGGTVGVSPNVFPVPGRVTLLNNNMWKVGTQSNGLRSQLMGNFINFLTTIETNLETAGIVPWGTTQAIGQWIADLMPAPLSETLFYRYSFWSGLVSGVPYVDIRPGMVLRVDTEASQFVGTQAAAIGYVGAGQFRYRVGSIPNPNPPGPRVVVFDSFLGSISAPQITFGSSAPNPLVAGGVMDFGPPLTPGNATTALGYVRLFSPPTVQDPSQPGNTSNLSNPALVASQSIADMADVTTNYLSTLPASPNVCTVFMGRTTVVPEIAIWIVANLLSPPPAAQKPPALSQATATLEYVPVGTTLNNIAERFFPSPAPSPLPMPFTQTVPLVNLFRWNTTLGMQTSANGNVPVAIPLTGPFDIPLIAGDVVVFVNN